MSSGKEKFSISLRREPVDPKFQVKEIRIS